MKLADPRSVAALVATGILASVSLASAQSAEAEVLFREGKKLLKAGKLAAGCDKIEASERLESSVGTLLNLGDCRERLGRLASAWSAFRKAGAMAKRTGGDGKRQQEALKRASALEPRLPNLVIQVSSRIDGLVIKRDGEIVDPALWNTPVPVDPDSYSIVVEAPGYKPWQSEVAITAKLKRKVVTIPQLERAPVPVAEPPPAARPVEPQLQPAAPATTITVRRAPGTWTTTRKLAIAVGVAGLGAVGTGVYFGLRAQDFEEQANERCPDVLCADPEALRLNDRAQDNALRANVLYAAGGAAAAIATVMWFVGGPDGETVVTPTVGSDRAGVSVLGRF
jgi:hypothetical protein